MSSRKPIQPEISIEVKALRRELDLTKRQLIDAKAGQGIIIEAVKQAYEHPPDFQIPKLLTPPTKLKKQPSETAVLHLSDLQIGKRTATYDSAIAEKRILLAVSKTLEIIDVRRSAAKINDVRLYLGGDLCEGDGIFASQPFEIDSCVFDQAVKTAPSIVAKAVLMLLQKVEKVRVISVPGNHGRTVPKHIGASTKTNWDTVISEVARHMLLGGPPSPQLDSLKKRLEWITSEGWYAVDPIYGRGQLIVHGDTIQGFSGFPWAGISKKMAGWIDSIPEQWQTVWLGHFHTYASGTVNYRDFLANGTTESSNVYAQSQLAACGRPCQRLAFYNEKYGRISEHQLMLD